MARTRIRLWGATACAAWLFCLGGATAPVVRAQEAPLVRFVLAANHEVRSTVRLPGTVVSRLESVVASEARGVVESVEAREGDRVTRGQPLARLRPIFYEIELRGAQGRLEEALARLELAESKLRRAKELFGDDVISQDALDDAHSEFTAWQGREVQSRADIARLRETLDRCVIRAPFSGSVVRERTEIGQWVEVGGPVMELVAPGEIELRVDVPERYYRALGAEAAVLVSFEALPDLMVDGRIVSVIPSADPRARTFPIRVGIPNPGGRVGVGMLGEAALPLGETRPALLLPKDAVVRQGGRELVFRIRSDDTVEPVGIESGVGIGERVAVAGPVAAGERIVVRGNERLRPGQAVRAEPLEPAP